MSEKLHLCPGCTEEYPTRYFDGPRCLTCLYGTPALAVVRGAKGFRRQEARFLSDDELVKAVEWWWVSNQPTDEGSRVYWTRPKLAAIARAWMREFQPEHLALLNRARQAAYREQKRARAEGCADDVIAHRGRMAWDAAVRRAVADDQEIAQDLVRYWPLTTGEGTDMTRATLEQHYAMPAFAPQSKGKSGDVDVVRVEPEQYPHTLAQCTDMSGCRWHRPKWLQERRREGEFLALMMNQHVWTCPTCTGVSTSDHLAAA